MRHSRKSGETTAAEFLRAVRRREEQLAASEWSRAALASLQQLKPPPKRVRCLALAGPSEWLSAQYQLAFLMLATKSLGIEPVAVTLWDPAFTDMDREVLGLCGFTVAEQDQDAVDDASTLWYLPHAPLSLMLSLTGKARQCFGNDMREFSLRSGSSLTSEQQLQLDQWSKARVTTFPLRQRDPWFQAMHDLALQELEPSCSGNDGQ